MKPATPGPVPAFASAGSRHPQVREAGQAGAVAGARGSAPASAQSRRASAPPRFERVELAAWIAIAAIACAAAFLNLDAQHLWQDEAQSALLARSTLEHGLPLGTDGRNFFSQEGGAEYDAAHRWRWHTWLHFYLVAASFAVLGESTAAARLPAALAGVASVLATGWLAGALWRRRFAALAAAAALAISVPFWILARQCRYYSLTALFGTLAMVGYLRLVRSERSGGLLFAGSLVALFHAHYVYVPPLLAAALLHCCCFQRARLKAVALAALVTLIACAPWIVWQSQMEYGVRYGEGLVDPAGWLRKAILFGAKLARYAVPIGLLVPAAAAALWRARRGHPLAGEQAGVGPSPWRARGLDGLLSGADDRSGIALLALAFAAIFAVVSVVSPDAFFRYLTPLLPLSAVAAGGVMTLLRAAHPVLAVVGAAILLLGQPLRAFVYELSHDFAGPLEGIVQFLNEEAAPDDVVLITYGDLPLKFYTDLRVLGGLTGEDLAPGRRADWVIPRHHVVHPEGDGRVARFVAAEIDLSEYRKIELPFADTRFENREEPAEHLYRSARGGPPVTLYRRRR